MLRYYEFRRRNDDTTVQCKYWFVYNFYLSQYFGSFEYDTSELVICDSHQREREKF
jgi:hypothetical protein